MYQRCEHHALLILLFQLGGDNSYSYIIHNNLLQSLNENFTTHEKFPGLLSMPTIFMVLVTIALYLIQSTYPVIPDEASLSSFRLSHIQ